MSRAGFDVRRPCPHEEEVRAYMVEEREPPADLGRHAEMCPRCRFARRAVARFAELAGPSPGAGESVGGTEAALRRLPPAAELWRTAELRRSLRAPERGARRLAAPLRLAEWASGGLALLAAAALAPWLASGIRTALPPGPVAATLGVASGAALIAVSLGLLGIARMRRSG